MKTSKCGEGGREGWQTNCLQEASEKNSKCCPSQLPQRLGANKPLVAPPIAFYILELDWHSSCQWFCIYRYKWELTGALMGAGEPMLGQRIIITEGLVKLYNWRYISSYCQAFLGRIFWQINSKAASPRSTSMVSAAPLSADASKRFSHQIA